MNRDALLRSFVVVAQAHESALSLERLRHDYALDDDELPLITFRRIALDCGFRTRLVQAGWERLSRLGAAFPAIATRRDGGTIILAGYRAASAPGGEEQVVVFDPGDAAKPFKSLSRTALEEEWDGGLILLKKHAAAGEVGFGLRWFLAMAGRQKRLFVEIALIALVLHGLALLVPLYFQTVTDRVIGSQVSSTLHVLTAGIVAAILFDGGLRFLRSYLLSFAVKKVDLQVAVRTFSHLMGLPQPFFDCSLAGIITKHLQQAETIRSFLTGTLLTTLLDSTALLVFLPVLFLLDIQLTLIVCLFLLVLAASIAVVLGPYQRALLATYEAEGRKQAMLVESIHGIATLKGLALEPKRRKVWDENSSSTVTTHFRVERIAAAAQAIIQSLQKLLSVAIIWFGTYSVVDGTMTLGTLIAFNMLCQYVTNPLMQIVFTVHEYQKTALAVEMLGHVMNHPQERAPGSAKLCPALRGGVEFENVRFSYTPGERNALDGVSFAIRPGEIVGVVGRSGSGKSTITRILQGLYVAQGGIVRLDGLDLREIDLAHLRRSIGVVMQDNFMFRGTVRDNIAMTKPGAALAEVVRAARLAGADEFIQHLPQGYDSLLEENARNLSGGQRQRLAIARALIKNPALLIFDEATSALDAESETIVQANLKAMAEGRTMIMVAHRFSSLRDAQRILVLDGGRVEAFDTPERLLRTSPVFRGLWKQQQEMFAFQAGQTAGVA